MLLFTADIPRGIFCEWSKPEATENPNQESPDMNYRKNGLAWSHGKLTVSHRRICMTGRLGIGKAVFVRQTGRRIRLPFF